MGEISRSIDVPGLVGRPLRAALLVALIGALLVLPRLGHRQIIGSHEAVFPVVARDMVTRDAWLSAELRGQPYRNKPPLYPWAIAAFSWPGGRVTEVSARLPGALAAIGAAVVTALLGARLFGPRAGVWAAVILLTSVVFFDHALTTIPDLLMVLFDLLAGLALWSVANGGGRRALAGFYAALTLAVFTKGVPGLLPLGVALVWLALDGGREGLRRIVWVPGLTLFGAGTAVWVVPYLTLGSRSFVSDVVWRDWLYGVLGRPSLTTVGVQVAYGALSFLPWTLVLPLALLAAVRARRHRPVAFALCWFTVQVAFVFAMQQQRLRYLLPLLPGAALLVAWWADREASAPGPRRALAAVALGSALTGALAAPLALRRLDVSLPAPAWEIGAVLLGIVAVGALAAATLWRGRLARAVPAVAAASAVVLFAGGWLVDDWENRAWDYRGAATGLGRLAPPLAVAALADDHELLQVDFYLGRSLLALRSVDAVRGHLASGGGAVVDTPRWRAVRQALSTDPGRFRASALGADVLMVTDDHR